MKLQKHKCPVCPRKYTMASSLSRHITDMVKKEDKAHMEHRGVKPKPEPLPLHAEDKSGGRELEFASPPSITRKPDEPDLTALSTDDLDDLKLPEPGEGEPGYVAPVEGIPAMAEVPYDNTQKVLEYVGDLAKSFGDGSMDSLTKMNKTDYELMAKHIAQSRGQDLSPGMAASVIYLKFIVFLIANLFKGSQRMLSKRKEKQAAKALAEKEANEAVKEDAGSTPDTV